MKDPNATKHKKDFSAKISKKRFTYPTAHSSDRRRRKPKARQDLRATALRQKNRTAAIQ